MFNKSRRRITLSIMVSLMLLFSSTMSMIIVGIYREMRRDNKNMLIRYVALYSLDHPPGRNGVHRSSILSEKDSTESDRQTESEAESGSEESTQAADWPESMSENNALAGLEPDEEGPSSGLLSGYELATFYSVAFDKEDGSVLAVDTGAKNLYNERKLIEMSRSLLKVGKDRGRIKNLTYMISRRSEYDLVAYIDGTVNRNNIRTMIRNVLGIGMSAIFVLFFLALYFSKQIIKPLEENDRKQKQFISDASHELKTPVAVIATNAEVLGRELGANEWLDNIKYENGRMGDLVMQLLDLSRAESTHLPMGLVDFSRVVTGEVLAFESLAYEKGKDLHSEIEEGICLTGNQTQLIHLVSVLLDNAIRHSNGEEIEVSLVHQGRAALLTVVNEGDEIPPEKQKCLFDRFYRLDQARNSGDGHYGLGLSIAKAVADMHGGNIYLSCSGEKISFVVSLPIKK